MQYNRNIVRVKQLLHQCDANSKDGEQSMNCIFCPDSGCVSSGQMNGIVWCVYVTFWIFHMIYVWNYAMITSGLVEDGEDKK